MRILGLTGGIGSGKSAAAEWFREYGIPIINADHVGHELLESHLEIKAQVVHLFGSQILQDGAISRERLAERVFSDAEARRSLDALLHPAILQAIAGQCEALRAQGHPVVIIEAALMAEHGRKESWMDGMILVLANRDTRIKRLAGDRGMTAQEIEQRLQAQSDPEGKRHLADWVIENNSSLDVLQRQVGDIAKALLRPSD